MSVLNARSPSWQGPSSEVDDNRNITVIIITIINTPICSFVFVTEAAVELEREEVNTFKLPFTNVIRPEAIPASPEIYIYRVISSRYLKPKERVANIDRTLRTASQITGVPLRPSVSILEHVQPTTVCSSAEHV